MKEYYVVITNNNYKYYLVNQNISVVKQIEYKMVPVTKRVFYVFSVSRGFSYHFGSRV